MDIKLEKFLEYLRAKDDMVKQRTERDIEAHRKSDMTLSFTDKDGNPMQNVQVSVNQKTHDFRFGCNLFMLDELETEEKNEIYKDLYPQLFNLATLPFYWCDLEPEQGKPRYAKDSPKVYRRPAPDLCLEFCEKHGIEPKLHCLNYDKWSPLWMPQDVPTIKKLLEARIRDICARYRDKIPGMEVTNEMLLPERYDRPNCHSTPLFREKDLVEWSFKLARECMPNNKLIINEATNPVFQQFRYDRSPYYMQIERALSKGAEIDCIGVQYHMFYRTEEVVKSRSRVFSPDVIFGALDYLSDFGKPLQITEVTVPAYSNDPEDEQAQAEILTYLYKMWFSHPNMEAIVYWNMVDGYAYAKEPVPGDMTQGENFYHGALLRFDMSKKPAWYALDELIHKTWHTEESANTGAGSTFTTRGFHGNYEITATVNGKTVTTEVHLEKGKENNFTIAL